jgi:hypothetical protein
VFLDGQLLPARVTRMDFEEELCITRSTDLHILHRMQRCGLPGEPDVESEAPGGYSANILVSGEDPTPANASQVNGSVASTVLAQLTLDSFNCSLGIEFSCCLVAWRDFEGGFIEGFELRHKCVIGPEPTARCQSRGYAKLTELTEYMGVISV